MARRARFVAPAIAPPEGCERLACVVPHCTRTFRHDKKGTPYPPGSEVICGKHWRLNDAGERRRYGKLRRLYKNKRGTLQGDMAARIVRLIDAEWERLKAKAIERAAGI